MIDNSDPKRDLIHKGIQEAGPHYVDKPAVLVGWSLVTEWMDTEGERWISKCHSSQTTTWAAAGLHHEALYGEWPNQEGDET